MLRLSYSDEWSPGAVLDETRAAYVSWMVACGASTCDTLLARMPVYSTEEQVRRAKQYSRLKRAIARMYAPAQHTHGSSWVRRMAAAAKRSSAPHHDTPLWRIRSRQLAKALRAWPLSIGSARLSSRDAWRNAAAHWLHAVDGIDAWLYGAARDSGAGAARLATVRALVRTPLALAFVLAGDSPAAQANVACTRVYASCVLWALLEIQPDGELSDGDIAFQKLAVDAAEEPALTASLAGIVAKDALWATMCRGTLLASLVTSGVFQESAAARAPPVARVSRLGIAFQLAHELSAKPGRASPALRQSVNTAPCATAPRDLVVRTLAFLEGEVYTREGNMCGEIYAVARDYLAICVFGAVAHGHLVLAPDSRNDLLTKCPLPVETLHTQSTL